MCYNIIALRELILSGGSPLTSSAARVSVGRVYSYPLVFFNKLIYHSPILLLPFSDIINKLLLLKFTKYPVYPPYTLPIPGVLHFISQKIFQKTIDNIKIALYN